MTVLGPEGRKMVDKLHKDGLVMPGNAAALNNMIKNKGAIPEELKKRFGIDVIGDAKTLDELAKKIGKKKLMQEVKQAMDEMMSAPPEPEKPHETDFKNNTVLDKLINQMSGEPERLSLDDIMPAYTKKMTEIQKELGEVAKAFNKKYANSPIRKLLLDTIAQAEKDDPDVSFTLACVSKRLMELRQREHGLMRLKLERGNKKITYPKDTIKKIEEL